MAIAARSPPNLTRQRGLHEQNQHHGSVRTQVGPHHCREGLRWRRPRLPPLPHLLRTGLRAGCPIARYTGKKFCKGSPYIEWYWHQNDVHGKMFRKVYCPECERLARNMRDFMVEIVDHLKAQAAAAETGNKREDPATRIADSRHGKVPLMVWVALGLTAETAVFVLAGIAWFLSMGYTLAEAGAGAVVMVFMALSLIHQISLFIGSPLPGLILETGCLAGHRLFRRPAGCRIWPAIWHRRRVWCARRFFQG
jgi:hypothetical protein